jgi:hypothetical protein
VLKRKLSCKREEVSEGRRKLYKEEYHNLYSSANIRMIKEDAMGGT